MQNRMQTTIENYKDKRVQKKKNRRILLALSLIAALCTSYLLILPAITKEAQAYCGYEEHIHGDGCYEVVEMPVELSEENTVEKSLICDVEESADHTHSGECFVINEVEGTPLVVNEVVIKCEQEEHEHSLECFSNPEADVETSDVWKATFENVELSGNWADDILAIAQTQKGYTESENNYIVDEDGKTKIGYTRYGQWYGMPYGEWSGMFVAFCLNYAGVEGVDYDQDVATWIGLAQDAKLYRDKAEYTPVPGDLVFLNINASQQQEELPFADEGSIKANAIGIVKECMPATANEPATIRVIAGDMEDRVGEGFYNVTDKAVIGYIELPEIPNPGNANKTKDEEALLGGTTYASIGTPSNGDIFHNPAKKLFYQFSSHTLDDGGVATFILAPHNNNENMTNWTPEGDVWSASNPQNYLVAYCADHETGSSTSGEDYFTYTLDNSRFRDVEQKRTIDGIIKHAYPFVTASEFKNQLKQAYINKEIDVDLSRDTCCNESEYLAAAQMAIWDATNATGNIKKITINSSLSSSWNKYYKHRETGSNRIGHTKNTTEYQNHIKMMRDWLVSQGEKLPGELLITDYDYEVTPVGEGLYDLYVDVALNRTTLEEENLQVRIIAGDREPEYIPVEHGKDSFELVVNGLTEDEITSAKVDIQLGVIGIQTFFFDSETYQDLIGGIYGTNKTDLSFNLAEELMDVSVQKIWSTSTPGANSIKVQLYANGEAYGDKVELSSINNWSYVWNELPKVNLLGKEMKYTVEEDNVSGYESSVTTTKGLVWVPVDRFEDGGTYLIQSRSGFLEQHTYKNNQRLTWSTIDVSNAASVPEESMWTVTKDGNYFKIKNYKNTNNYLGRNSNNYFEPSTSSAQVNVTDDNKLYFYRNSTKYYFTIINGSGYGETTQTIGNGANFKLYKLTEVDADNADVNFVITNNKIESTTNVVVKKSWSGDATTDRPVQIEVMLLRDGVEYSGPVVLNSQNGWNYKWSNIPDKIGEKSCTYTVKEIGVAGYVATSRSSTSTSLNTKTTTITLTNTWKPEYADVSLSKVDLDNNREISGAQFELYRTPRLDKDIVTISPAKDISGSLIGTYIVNNTSILIEDLVVGETYYLLETKAPEGYNILSEPITFMIDKVNGKNVLKILDEEKWASAEGLSLKVKNEKFYELPDTGGIGDEMFKIAGAILMIVAAFILLKRRSVKL